MCMKQVPRDLYSRKTNAGFKAGMNNRLNAKCYLDNIQQTQHVTRRINATCSPVVTDAFINITECEVSLGDVIRLHQFLGALQGQCRFMGIVGFSQRQQLFNFSSSFSLFCGISHPQAFGKAFQLFCL